MRTFAQRFVAVVSLATCLTAAISLGISSTLDEAVVFWLTGVPLGIVGAVLVLRVPSNSVSWLTAFISLGFTALTIVDLWLPQSASFALTGFLIFLVLLPGLGVLLPLLFPTGGPPSRKWRWVLTLCVASTVTIAAGFAWTAWIDDGNLADTGDCSSTGGCIQLLGLVGLLVGVVAAFVSFGVRWRRSVGVEREQLRWLIPPFLILVVGLLVEFGGFQDNIVAVIALPLGLMTLPLGIGIAITRYRLYEIDRIISRTVSYTLVVGLLGVVFAVGVVWIPGILQIGESPLLVAATTLAVAALFNPLRRRVQRIVDRRFNRSKYDAERVMDEFAGSLRDGVDEPSLVAGWVTVVSETMEPGGIGVWVR